MKYIFFLSSLLLGLPGMAQYTISDQATPGTTGDERIYQLLEKANGNLLGIGASNGIDSVLANNGQYDIWLSEYDQELNLVGQKNYGGPGNDEAKKILQDEAGNFFICGLTDSLGGDFPIDDSIKKQQGFLMKLDPNGEILFSKTFGWKEDDGIEDMIFTSDGNIVLIGYAEEWTNENMSDNTDIYLAKMDLNCNVIWEKFLGSSDDDEGKNVIELDNGNLAICGFIRAADGDVGEHFSAKDIWLAEIDQAGNLVWENSFGGNKSEVPADLIQLQNQNLLLVAESFSEMGNYHGGGDFWLIETDSNGQPVQDKFYGGTSFESPKQLLEKEEGKILIAGETFSIDGDVQTSFNSINGWLLEIETDFEIGFSRVFGGNQFDGFFGIFENSNGEMFLNGFTDSSDGDLANKHGNHQGWIIKLNEVISGIEDNDLENKYSVDQFYHQENNQITFKSETAINYCIYNTNGQELLKGKSDFDVLDLSHLNHGVYLMRMQIEKIFFTSKILIK